MANTDMGSLAEVQRAGDADILQLVTFSLGGEEFGVDILKVQEIIRPMEITKVPNAPMFVEGVINLRGKVIPIIDLRKRFRKADRKRDHNTRFIVLNICDTTAGFVVDAVSEVLRVSSSTVEPPPPVVGGLDSEYIKGVAKLEEKLLILLDMDKVLSGDELAELNVC